MNQLVNQQEEAGLDPDNWDTIRELGHRMVDDMIGYLQQQADGPAWRPVPAATKEYFRSPVPRHPQSLAGVYESFREHILPYPMGNIHPRFWGWVMGTGSITGALADMLASAMNSNVCLGEQSALYVEQQVIDWCRQLFRFPEKASGLLVSGASMANLTAILVARNHKLAGDVRRFGVQGTDHGPLLYCSSETHSCIVKAAEIAGLGSSAVRKIEVDAQYRIRTDLLRKAIEDDISFGNTPFCIVGNAGTVNTGAIDPLGELQAIAREYDLWFHVDGAFGSLAAILPEMEEELGILGSVDSLAFDLHKWMYVPYETGGVLFRDARAHRDAFAATADYLLLHERGASAGPDSVGNYGIELSRGFKALKVWMTIKEHGMDAHARLIRQNIHQAQFLGQLIEQESRLELLAPVSLNIVCFRYVHPGISKEELNHINREIVMSLQEKGIAVPSSTMLNGNYSIRVAICNHRSRRPDFELLVGEVLRLGEKIAEPEVEALAENLDC